MFQEILELNDQEIDEVSGAGYLAGAAAAAGALAAVAGAAASVPSPATPGLIFTTLALGLLSAGLGYADSKF